jgi:cation:H+ antiporter
MEGGEGAISGTNSIFIFISGAALLVYSAEKLIAYLVKSANGLGVSAFVLAIVFTGIEFDDIALGVALGLEGLSGVALGVVFGTALSLSGVALALACILTPTEVHIPRDYLVLFAVSPLVILPFVFLLEGGTLTTIGSVILIALFVLFISYVAYRERATGQPVIRNQEVMEIMDGGAQPAAADIPSAVDRKLSRVTVIGFAVIALVGLVIGAATTGMGAEGIITAYGIEGTVFGATIATAVLTIEDIVLTVEPIRKGAPEIAVGNVIGSIIFSVTGKLGVIGLAGSIAISGYAFTWHFPALLVLTLLAAYFICTRRLKPWQGYTLLGLYVSYWATSYFLLGVLPAEM